MQIINNTYAVLFDQIINPAITLFSVLAFAWFLYGVVIFIKAKLEGKDDALKKGKNHMLWGIVGLIIIFSAGEIYKLIIGLFN